MRILEDNPEGLRVVDICAYADNRLPKSGLYVLVERMHQKGLVSRQKPKPQLVKLAPSARKKFYDWCYMMGLVVGPFPYGSKK